MGTAGAIKAISHHLTAKNILVEYPPSPALVSCDLKNVVLYLSVDFLQVVSGDLVT